MSTRKPLVSIGLPTYNRAVSLKRAVESALAQDFADLELVISDNASTDATQTICEDFCRRDNRVRYLRQASNIGLTANFQAAWKAARGDFFMWLADDDWIDRDYVSRCLVYLGKNPDCLLVGGREKYYQGAEFIHEEGDLNLPENTGTARVLAYFRQVKRNGIFYGLMPSSTLDEIPRLDILGGDWLFLSHVAFRGKMKTIADVSINRSIGGISQDAESMAQYFSLSHFEKRHIFLNVALRVFKDIAWGSPVFRSLGVASRWFLACRSAIIILSNWSLGRWVRLYWVWNDLRARLILRTRLRLLTRKWLHRG
jgi:glycosyltransferase involved in cell wall biosynthesis